jgi:hypothetical protein
MAAQPGVRHPRTAAQRIASVIATHTLSIVLIIALVSTLAWVAYEFSRPDPGIPSPGPVTTVHKRESCWVCHVQQWHTIKVLVAADQKQVRRAMDQACIKCHPGLVHHRNEIPEDAPNCVGCHSEHQGDGALVAADEDSCTTCHADLRTTAGPSTQFSRTISGFASHPEFAVLRQARADRARIRFDHAKHLSPEGLPGLDGKPVILKCASCHRTAADGRYMEPISFQDHCFDCHSNSLLYDAARFPDNGVPHGSQPELLRGLIRKRYTQFIRQNAAELGKEPGARARRPIPGPSRRDPVAEREWTWVGLQVERADRILFQSSSGCRYCHSVEADRGSWHVSPTEIPERWLTHSRFSHFAHRLSPRPPAGQENCSLCHERARGSTRTDEVLMPSFRKCRECHNQEATPKERARTECTECHIYHNEVGGRRPLDVAILPACPVQRVGQAPPIPSRVTAQTTAEPVQGSSIAMSRELSSIFAWLSSPDPQRSSTRTPPPARTPSPKIP